MIWQKGSAFFPLCRNPK